MSTGNQQVDGMASMNSSRLKSAAAAALALLVGGLVHEIARASRDAELVLAPLGHFIGEPGFGPMTRVLLSGFEGAAFGCALTWGLTRRPATPEP